MTAGESFVKMLKPAGCILFLLLFVIFLIFCFTAKAPLEGYVKPQTTEYYLTHLEELEQELETNMFPRLEGIEDCYVNGDRLTIIISSDDYEESSGIITHYYGKELFDIQKSKK